MAARRLAETTGIAPEAKQQRPADPLPRPSKVPAEKVPVPPECERALIAWLRWNDAYERVTAEMYKAGTNQRQLQDLMDQLDRLRREAISLSRKLVD